MCKRKRRAHKNHVYHGHLRERKEKSNQVSAFSLSLVEDECDAVNDRISELPQELLSVILSHLTLQEAVRTSILSKRWRHVWSSVSKLDFDAINIVGGACDARSFRKHNQDKFVRCIYQVLQLHQSQKIESFRLQCCLGQEYGSEIDRWLQLAVNEALQNLDIDLSEPSRLFPSAENSYRIPNWIFEGRLPSLKHLDSLDCRSQVSPRTKCLGSLTSLTLASINVSQDHINIVCDCPNLQRVNLSSCHLPSLLQLASPKRFPPLKHLTIVCCRLMELEICDAVGLLSFECIGTLLRQLTLHNIAKPLKICYGHSFCHREYPSLFYDFGKLVTDLPEVEELALILPLFEEIEMPLRLPTFGRLQELMLDLISQHASDALKFICSLLKASPYLQKLQVTQPQYTNTPLRPSAWLLETQMDCCYLHEHLREVNLYRFLGKPSELEVVLYLLQHTTALEKIEMYRSIRRYYGNGQWEKWGGIVILKRRLCKVIQKCVSSKVGSTSVQLLLF